MTPSTPSLLAVLAVATVATAGAVAIVRRWAASRLLDVPNERSSHQRPVPRGGGLGIVLVVSAGYLALVGGHWPPMVWMGAVALATVSFLDDMRPMAAYWRLGAHGLVAAGVVATMGPWQVVALPGLDPLHLGAMGTVLGAIWIVGLANAYNFMDGVDGMAAGQAIVAGSAWMVLGSFTNELSLATVGALVAGAAAGFLFHNWPPARIFMGDVGSVTLGYVFALLAILGASRSPRLALAGVVVVWPFVFDTAFTFLRRAGRRENVLNAHRSHLYQRLNKAGWSHRSVSGLYSGLAVLGSTLAMGYVAQWPFASVAVLATVPMAAAGLVALVRHTEHHAASSRVAQDIRQQVRNA